jgi:hypothetical protein
MSMRAQWAIMVAGLVGLAGSAVVLHGQNPQTPAGAAPAAPAPAGAQILLAPGLREVPDYRNNVVIPTLGKLPEGMDPIFNGKDLTGWHISKTARHGLTPDFHAAHNMILGTQQPFGSGGLLLTDANYKDFELYFEAKPDWGCDSGVFFRTTENGAAYQITMDYLPGGSMGRLIGEGGITVTTGGGRGRAAGAAAAGTAAAPRAAGAPAPDAATAAQTGPGSSNDPGMKAWKPNEWNTVLIRVQGEVPHATVWINGTQVSDATDSENHAVGGMYNGPVALQVHGGGVRWQPGGFWRWRNIALKELKEKQ